jgi:hypothetical protein
MLAIAAISRKVDSGRWQVGMQMAFDGTSGERVMKLSQQYKLLFIPIAQFEPVLTWSSKKWRFISRSLVGRQEPQIWRREYKGEMLYDAYDPITGRSLRDATEAEVRVWLERLSYRGLKTF